MKEKIPIISHAMLVGDKAKFLSMLLTLKVMSPPAPGSGGGERAAGTSSAFFFFSTRVGGQG